MEGSAISTIRRRSTTRPCNLSRVLTQPASLRCALAWRQPPRSLVLNVFGNNRARKTRSKSITCEGDFSPRAVRHQTPSRGTGSRPTLDSGAPRRRIVCRPIRILRQRARGPCTPRSLSSDLGQPQATVATAAWWGHWKSHLSKATSTGHCLSPDPNPPTARERSMFARARRVSPRSTNFRVAFFTSAR